MKALQLLLNSYLPEDLRDYNRQYDAKTIGKLMADVAHRYPDRYAEIAKKFADAGRKASYYQGETLTLSDMRPTFDRDAILQKLDADIEAARAKAPNDEAFNKERERLWLAAADVMQKAVKDTSLAAKNNLAYNVVSGARGKAPQLQAMIATPGLYTDYKGDLIPIFVRRSFGEGLRPAEFLAGTFGARLSVISTKNSTADGGDLSKQLVQATARQIVTMKDCGVHNGIDLDPSDDSLRGRVLLNDVAGAKAGSIVDARLARQISKSVKGPVLVRSALTCQAPDGICAKCAGALPDDTLPKIGDAVGITAAQAVGEPITQAALNSKHTGGQASGKRVYSGFNVLNQLVQVPDVFPDRAAVAEIDGKVERVEPAPQGGSFVLINGQQHYVAPGYELNVKAGDVVEAGDQLADGIVNPADIVRLRGLGEGRRTYASRLKQALDDTGLNASTRNVEMLARAAVDHVTVNDPDGLGDYLPDDVASYNRLAATYTPPPSTKTVDAGVGAIGKFLQRPVLHYSIGTKLTPKMVDRISKAGFAKVDVDDTAPSFTPEVVRLRTASQSGTDWMAKLHTSYLRSNLAASAVRGEDTDIASNTHFAPRLAHGVDFGKTVRETGRF